LLPEQTGHSLLPLFATQLRSGNPGGRPGLPEDVKALTRDLSPAAIETLASIMRDKNAPPAARVSAANAILDRGSVLGYQLRHVLLDTPF
jgi:hypothetical protein